MSLSKLIEENESFRELSEKAFTLVKEWTAKNSPISDTGKQLVVAWYNLAKHVKMTEDEKIQNKEEAYELFQPGVDYIEFLAKDYKIALDLKKAEKMNNYDKAIFYLKTVAENQEFQDYVKSLS